MAGTHIKMNSSYFVFAFFLLLFFNSCKNENSKFADKVTGSYYEIQPIQDNGNIELADIKLIIDANENYTKGIKLLCTPSLTSRNKQLRRTLSDLGYKGYIINVNILSKNGRPVNSRPGQFKKKQAEPLVFEKFLTQLQNHPTEVFIPYFALDIPKDTQELIIRIEGYAAELDSVKDESGFGYALRKKTNVADAVTDVILHFRQPQVFGGSLKVCRFCINKTVKDPHSYDYRVLGSGYPDLYWELFNGKELIYTSPIEKNRVTYDVCYNTPRFYFSEKDSIRLAFWDNDELSKPDYIGEWIGSPYELQKLGEKNPQIAFDKVTECKIVLDLIEDKK